MLAAPALRYAGSVGVRNSRFAGALVLGALLTCGCKGHARRTRAEAALARVGKIERELAAVRGLAFEHAVPASFQTPADFRAFVHLAVGLEGSHLRDRQEALVALGLLPRGIDLGRAVEDGQVTQAAAYYAPAAKRFFLVRIPDSDQKLDLISAHELTHALQDQHFGVTHYLRGGDNSDARAARKFVTEGDAMFSSIAYLVFAKTKRRELTPEQLDLMRSKLEQFAMADPAGMVAMLRNQASVSSHIDPDLEKALEATKNIPLTVLVPLFDAYTKGAVLALDAYQHGGWPAIDALYHDPPESTEQVLHPDRLLPVRDHPRRITLPKLGGYKLVESDVLGELQWSVYFSLWKHTGEVHAEENWGGDRYAVLRGADGIDVALVATVWDTEYDAKEFHDAYVSTLKARYGGAPSTDGGQLVLAHGADSTWVRRVGQRVYIVDGGHDPSLMDTLVAGSTFE